MQEGEWSLYISFHNHSTHAGTGKFIYKVSILDEQVDIISKNQALQIYTTYNHHL